MLELRKCHNCENPILLKDLAFGGCAARCTGGDLPMHYRCIVYDKRSKTKLHKPDPKVIAADTKFMKWAERVTK